MFGSLEKDAISGIDSSTKFGSEIVHKDIGGNLKESLPIGTSRRLPPDMPFKEHHLKQLRAQCLVFLAFRQAYNAPPF